MPARSVFLLRKGCHWQPTPFGKDGYYYEEKILHRLRQQPEHPPDADEAALDRYEGFPTFYYKKEMQLPIKGIKSGKTRIRDCFVYIMHEERSIGVPSLAYVGVCLEGYISFGFCISLQKHR